MKPYWLFAILPVFFATSLCHAGEIFNTTITDSSTIDSLGWTGTGQPWTVFNYAKIKADLANNPGPVFKLPGRGAELGTLVKKFPVVANPATLTLTFNGGWGWGGPANNGGLLVLLLDDQGNGYAFEFHRVKAPWAAQWGLVKENKYPAKEEKHWAAHEIDASQPCILDGGGLQTFTITRGKDGKWQFGGAKWTGATPCTFTDNTTSSFSQVVLYGTPNVDDMVFSAIKLEATY